MWRFLVRALAVVGGLALLAFGVTAFLVVVAISQKPTVPSRVILETELQRGLGERKSQGLFDAFDRAKPTVRDMIDALERGADDSRVQAVVSDLSQLTAGSAQIQELRDAVLAFRKKGKHAVAFADSFGELGPSNGAYYLATAYDEIYVQPSGSVGLTGLATEMLYVRELLEKLGVKAVFFKRREYKSAPEMFTERGPTAPAKEQTEALLDSVLGQVVRGIARERKLEETTVRGLVDQGPFLAEEALKAKLIDGLAYRDEVYAKVRSKAGESAKTLYLSEYLKRAGRPNKDAADKIALIFGTGNVVRSAPGDEDLQDQNAMRSGEVAMAFRQAAEDDRVKAIVFRIDSPGGSYVASDTIRRAVELARKKGKPVIASMGNLAASGGYFVAMEADKIVAQPATLTGSIGVYSGKYVTQDLWAKLGVSWSELHRGKNATLLSPLSDFTPDQRARMDAWLDAVYADFTQKAAAGRHLPLERLQELAKGRVWTGEEAQKRGLVDVLGGLTTAIALAKEGAKLPADAGLKIQVFPKEKTPVEELARLLKGHTGDSSEDDVATSLRWPEPAPVRALRRLVFELGLDGREQTLSASVPDVVW